MASHQLAIAKASFTASLLRPDPTSVLRDEISYFQSLVNLVAIHCSATNVQNCKRWISGNVTHSTARFAAFGKYLTALSTSFKDVARSSVSDISQREPSAKRKRLHLLYLINDILHHATYHAKDASVPGKMQPYLIGLLSSTACFANSPKHHRKIEGLLDIWESKNYYSMDYIDKLREAIKIARDAEQSSEATQPPNQNVWTQSEPRPYRNTPFIIPAIHGDQGTPWYDLPAGNLMPHLTPNSTRPINPNLVRPLRFVAGPAEEDLANAVKKLLQDVNNIFDTAQRQDRYKGVSWDIDELGQEIFHDEAKGEALSIDGYYGWSKPFCEKMKTLQKGLENSRKADHHNERRSRSQSQTSSLGRNHYKRQRFSNSDGESTRGRSRSRSRSRFGRRSYSSSRSRSREMNTPPQRDRYAKVTHETNSRSASQDRNVDDITSATHISRPPLNAYPNLVRDQFGEDTQSISALQQAFLQPSGHHFPSTGTSIASSLPPYSRWPSQPLLPPLTVPHAQQLHSAEAWPQPPPPPPFIPDWPVASYGQFSTGPHHLGGNSGGTYIGRERGGAHQEYQVPGSDYNRYSGDSKENHRWS